MKTSSLFRRLTIYLWREWVRPLALPLLAILAAKSSLADINPVPTGSMQPTILCGDALFVNKLAYDLKVPFTKTRLARWADPAPGEVVICFAPDDGTRLVKRVVGVPGDTIEMRQAVLWRNGQPLRYTPLTAAARGAKDLEPTERQAAVFAREELGRRAHAVMALPGRTALRDFGPVRVPAGHYFLMGDNRDNSRDSRSFGFVSRRDIVGRAATVAVSGDLGHGLRPRWDRFWSALD